MLEPGSKKFYCPECSKKRFVRYIAFDTGDYLPDKYGRCDRESKCSYHLNPYQDGYNKNTETQVVLKRPDPPSSKAKESIKPVPSFIPLSILQQTRSNYERNVFIQNLLSNISFPFQVADIEKLISIYHLGTVSSGYRSGAITVPFIDVNNRVRAIQVKEFDEQNHTKSTDFFHSIIEKEHIKEGLPLPDWLEKYKKNDLKVSCLFGEHLLSKYPNNPVALVEAPKTALYGSLYYGFPDGSESGFVWLAAYNKSSFTLEKLKAIEGRDVYVFPDLSEDGKTFSEWRRKSVLFEEQLRDTRFIFSDLLESLAPKKAKAKGFDLGDFLIKLDWRQFRVHHVQAQPVQINQLLESEEMEFLERADKNLDGYSATSLTDRNVTSLNIGECKKEAQDLIKPNIYKEKTSENDWDIEELEAFFKRIELPTKPLKLNAFTKIGNVEQFINAHLAYVYAHRGKKAFLPYLERLKELKFVLESHNY
jgi:hypothetical protein